MFLIVTDQQELVDRFVTAFSYGVSFVRESPDRYCWRVTHRELEAVTAVILDFRTPDHSLRDLVDATVRFHRQIFLFAVVEDRDVRLAGDLAQAGVDRCIGSSEPVLALREIVLETMTRFRPLSSPFQDTPGLSQQLVGSSPGMQKLRDLIRKAARSDQSVLVLGETGVGKELVARALHQLSPRSAGPYTPVNMSAITGTLFESTMFGSRRGAFTDAVDSDGIVGATQGGTLFLDEIGEMPAELQPKLLRLLEDGSYRPVGASHDRSGEFRVVAATNRSQSVLVRGHGLRPDLYHRLARIRIRIPALRDHIQDIEEICYHILKREGRGEMKISAGVVQIFQRYSWPGNVRELQSVLIRSLLEAPGPVIQVRDVRIDGEDITGLPGSRRRAKPVPADLPGLLPD